MQTVTIPQGFKPFKVTINYQDYEFEPGKEYTVADDVYEQIKHHIAGMELPEGIIGDPFAPYDVAIRMYMASPTALPEYTLLKGSYSLVKNRILNKVPVNAVFYWVRHVPGEGEGVPEYEDLGMQKIEHFSLESNRIYIDANSDAYWYPATDTEPERIEAMAS